MYCKELQFDHNFIVLLLFFQFLKEGTIMNFLEILQGGTVIRNPRVYFLNDLMVIYCKTCSPDCKLLRDSF